jgi:ABC-type amino acid transport system permease subunit
LKSNVKYQKQKKCTRSESPIKMSFYGYIIPKETIILQIHIKKKRKWLKFLNWPLKIYIRIISIIPILIQVLIPDFIFPVYKIDSEQSEKSVSKERLKMPKRYSEAGLWELSKGLNIFYKKGPLYCALVIIA